MTRTRLRPGLVLLGVLLAWATGVQGDAQRPPAGSPVLAPREHASTPAIGGTVRDALTGAPVAGAVVSLGRGTPTLSLLSNPAGRHVTDPSGRYLFTNLEILTTYYLTASAPGRFDGGYGLGPNGGTLQPFRLTSDAWMADVDIPLLGPAALGGHVTGEGGEPLVDVRVMVLSREIVAGTARWMIGPGTTTDDQGRYRIAPLLPGDYLVMVPAVRMTVPAEAPLAERTQPALDQRGHAGLAASSRMVRRDAVREGASHLLWADNLPPFLPAGSGDRRRAYVTTFHPGVASLDSGRAISVGAGEERDGVDIRLQPAPVFTVSGSVRVASPETPRLTVRLLPRGREHMGLGHEVAIARSGADGRFALLDVPAGEYVLLAGGSMGGYVFPFPGALAFEVPRLMPDLQTFGFRSRDDRALLLRANNADVEPYAGVLPVTVTARDLLGLAVPLSQGVAIRGRLVQENVATSSTSASLTEYRRTIVAEPAGGEPMLGLPQAVARPAGASLMFSIENVLPGEYVLRAQGDAVKSVRWNGQDYTERPLPVTAGADLAGVVITTAPPAANLRGAVWNTQGEAAPATVICFPADPSAWRRTGLASPRIRLVPSSVNVAGESRFLQSMPAGEYYVVALSGSLPRLWQEPAFLAALARLGTRVTVGSADTPPIDLTVVTVPRAR